MLTLTVALASLPSAQAVDLLVPDQFATAQAAVNAASNGDRIVFTEAVPGDFTINNKRLELVGDNFFAQWDGTAFIENGADVTITEMLFSGGVTETDSLLIELGFLCQGQATRAVDVRDATLTVVDSEFECYRENAIHAEDSDVTVQGGLFRFNYFDERLLPLGMSINDFGPLDVARAIVHVGGDLTIEDDAVFESNSGLGDGGAVYAESDTLRIVDSVFASNSTSIGGRGGAVYAASDVVEMHSNEFQNNFNLEWFVQGIATGDLDDLFAAGGDVIGLAIAFGDGGAVFLEDPPAVASDVDVWNNLFCGNLADEGAGLYIDDIRDVQVQNNRFADNWSMHFGGGMYVRADEEWGSTGEEAKIWNNTFANNTAGLIPPPYLPLVVVIGGGGGMALDGTVVDMRNNIIGYTDFGGGVMGIDGSDYVIGDFVAMEYNIFHANCDQLSCAPETPILWQDLTGDLAAYGLSQTNPSEDPFPTYFGEGEFNCTPDAFYPDFNSVAVRNGDPSLPNIFSAPASDIGAYGGPRADVLDRDGDSFENIYDCNDEPVFAGQDVFPGAQEVCDGFDNNCDGLIDEGFETVWWTDADGDGDGDENTRVVDCQQPPNTVNVGGDCDDTNSDVSSLAVEMCNGLDDNCDLVPDNDLALVTLWNDGDIDGFGAGEPLSGCPAEDGNLGYYVQTGVVDPFLVVSGLAENGLDCNDFDSNVSPAAAEVCDGLDNDCNTFIDDAQDGGQLFFVDADGDGFGTGTGEFGCEPPNAYSVPQGGDCNDADAAISPGANEVCDGLDNDCDGTVDRNAEDAPLMYEDIDNDGLGNPATATRDCDPGDTFTADNGDDCDDSDPNTLECSECGCAATPSPGMAGVLGAMLTALVALRRREDEAPIAA